MRIRKEEHSLEIRNSDGMHLKVTLKSGEQLDYPVIKGGCYRLFVTATGKTVRKILASTIGNDVIIEGSKKGAASVRLIGFMNEDSDAHLSFNDATLH